MQAHSKNIIIGEWFCANEGIAIAERVHDFYYEEYDDIPEGKKVGDYNLSMVEINCSAITKASLQGVTDLKTSIKNIVTLLTRSGNRS